MISIIVPVYNGEKYVNKCANALMSQSYKDIEIIFVNDGSTDNTQRLLEQLGKDDNLVKIFTKENGGVSSARNLGLKEANGDYIMFCDVDDIPEPTWCEELLLCAEKHTGKLPLCAAKKIVTSDASENFLFTLPAEERTGEYTELSKNNLLMIDDAGMLYSLWNKIFSARIIKDSNINFDESVSNGEDALFVLKYLSETNGETVFVNKNLYSYIQQNPDCLSNQTPFEEMLTQEKIFDEFCDLFEKIGFENSDNEKNFYEFYLTRYIETLGKIIKNKKDARFERLKKSNASLKLPGFKKCLFAVEPAKSCHGKLIKIYRSKIIGWLYNFRLVYF